MYSPKRKTTSLSNHLQRIHPREYAMFLKEDSAYKSDGKDNPQGTSNDKKRIETNIVYRVLTKGQHVR